ncbi:MAG: ATP-dependent Clp protease adapter ClpS [Desulfobulbaceae bacterium]|uniref:ATP-dependent Clp protease adapter protein ClpS n=1 Tax=Candidatus Desulfatifera sulfidica TaxID=2841691 RepID=A0A8J6NB44_9BACT|nr:ATP-dependent Clp protease adapter ClpS [Candidatus Desulfatifera sulfidica]
MSTSKGKHKGELAVREELELHEPSLYKVLLHNDDYTSMDFVILVLEHVFRKSMPEATKIMLNVHQQGVGVAGVYTREICETKIVVVREMASKNEFPLRCTMEKI